MKKIDILCLNSKNKIENEIIDKMFKDVKKMSYKELMQNKIDYKDVNQLIIFVISDETIDIIEKLKEKVKIKVISDIYEGILFNHKEKDNYLKVLEYLKNKDIYKLYFLKKGVYEAYKIKNYNVGYIMPNYIVNNIKTKKKSKENLVIGAYKHHFNWNNNTVNTLSVARFFDNSLLVYNRYDDYIEKDFLDVFKINYKILEQFKDLDSYLKSLANSSIVLDLEFTNNFNLNFMMASELKIPCLLGNNSDFFYNLDFKEKELFVTSSEDNPYLNSLKIKELLNNKNLEKILNDLYKWKQEYNKLQKENMKKVMED
jgi:hypothetical protein